MKLPTLILSFFLLPVVLQKTPATNSTPQESDIAPKIYDPNPKHIWNQLYDALLIRRDQTGTVYGADGLDPLLWSRTEHLLSGPSHQRALAVLDEFLRTHAQTQVRDPAKRALFASKLWAVFDW